GTPINLYDNAIAAAATTLATPAGQWIMQDLGCNRTFSSVKLSAVTVANLNGAELQVSTNGTTWTSLTTTNTATGVSGATLSGVSAVYPITFTFASQTGRYVRVYKGTASIVETTEFQISPEFSASSATTLALYGTKATIDNGTYTDGFTTTATAGITQWAMVNLGAPQTFSHIQLGTNATPTNLAGSTIQTSLDGVTWTNQLTNIAAPTASKLYTYFFTTAVNAQYVRVIKDTTASTLGISEFIVSPGVALSSESAKPAIANFSGLYDNAIAATTTTISAANQFVMLDLGSNKTFSNVQIAAGTAVGNLDGAALQTSTDGITWNTLSFTNAATGVTSTTFTGSSIVYPITYTFASQTARYIRVFRSATGIVSLGEFRVGSAVFQSSATTLANNAIPSQFNDASYTTGTLTATT
ncbi:MAG: discoidin domain-containing protein, partial [Dolichospermum sp.]